MLVNFCLVDVSYKVFLLKDKRILLLVEGYIGIMVIKIVSIFLRVEILIDG